MTRDRTSVVVLDWWQSRVAFHRRDDRKPGRVACGTDKQIGLPSFLPRWRADLVAEPCRRCFR